MSELAARIVGGRRKPCRRRPASRSLPNGLLVLGRDRRVAALAAGLEAYRLGESLRGFHVFNEGFYLLNGIKDVARPIFAPITAPLDPNNPWVYPFALSLALRVFGATIATARLVSIVAGVRRGRC